MPKKHIITSTLAALATLLAIGPTAMAQATPKKGGASQTIASPSGSIVVSVATGADLRWSVTMNGQPILLPSKIGMTFNFDKAIGKTPVIRSSKTATVNQTLRPVLKIKRAEIKDRYNERRIDFAGDYSLTVRAYDDGVAYRFSTKFPGNVEVTSEDAEFQFSADHKMYFPEETSFISHQEREYKHIPISEVGNRFSSLPAIVEMPPSTATVRVAITEADLLDYPGMNLTGAATPNCLKGLFPYYPAKVALRGDRTEMVTQREQFMAKTKGARDFPWRVLVLAENDSTFLDTDIVYRLASETRLTDTSWIRPGKVAWDWWNDNNIYGVPFHAGVNTETYKHYIDFAAENGIEYIILDEGWYVLGDLMKQARDINIDAIAAHAKDKKVGLIMWVVWKTLDMQMAQALDQFEKWGVKGIKVDFMQREDQWMVNYYEKVAIEAAKRKLMVDFHGAYKPTGLYRTYPNVLTSEGVLGLEQCKWGELASPDRAVTFPFMRMMAGPVDYTPGAMLNATKRDFRPINSRPMSQGTRCQQLAMYVVYESPLQMLADSPSNYRREPECLSFLSAVPTVWDETRVISASIENHILTARRSGNDWYVGALTNWDARDLVLPLTFLGAGQWDAEIFMDGPNADRIGIDYQREVKTVSAQDTLKIHLAPGGGWAAKISKKKP
ncbi:MAG: glycoside hydrolase family 97 protein [Holophagales bacterium]|jgi:alpha-glucosidase|nr:glycoside hydrolase family 97 protein [Holophagales bacterium]